MTKVILNDLVNPENQTSTVNTTNANNAVIETAFDNTLSRDGSTPNQMEANLDMNSNHILNLPAPISADEPVRLTDIQDLTAGGTIIFNSIPVGGTRGQTLTKNSSSNYDANWKTPQILTPELFGAVAGAYSNDPTHIALLTDSTQAFIDAISALATSQGGLLQLSAGVYKLTSNIAISHDNVFIAGQGEKATFITFEGDVGSGFTFAAADPTHAINYCGIRDLSIGSSDAFFKNAINVADISNFNLDNITVAQYPQLGGLFPGVGLRVNGRELGHVRNFTSYAQNPLIIAPNPNSPISLDSWTFENCNFVAHLDTSSSNPNILVLDNTNLFNVHFCGAQNWQGGTNGFQWINTTASQASLNVTFSGVKSEQCPDAVAGFNAYTFFITTNNVVRGLDIQNSTAGDRNGIFLRNVLNPTIRGFLFDPVIPNVRGLDVDSTAGTVYLEGCNWFSTTTASLTGLNLIQASGTPAGFFLSSALPPRGFYSTQTSEAFGNISTNTLVATGGSLFYGGTAVPAGGTTGTGVKLSSATNFGVFFGSGVPTLSAAQGSLFIRSDGSSTSTRLYVNTNGTTGWTNVTTAT